MHNYSRDWQIFNETNFKKQYYVETIAQEMQFSDLKKYHNYCIAISGSTVKGFGPVSAPICNLTLEDSKNDLAYPSFEY